MAKAKDIAVNAYEDFFDEWASLLVYKDGDTIFKSAIEKLNLGDSNIEQALESSLTGLKYSIFSSTVQVVTTYALAKSALVLTGLISFIKSRRLIQSLTTGLGNALSGVPVVGRVAGNLVKSTTNVIIGNQNETLAVTKMANDTSNNLFTVFSQERQNQIMLHGQKVKRVDTTKSNLYQARGNKRDTDMQLYYHKFKYGKWKRTTKDKNLYFNCSGQARDSIVFNSDFVKQLNSYTDFIKTLEGEILSSAKIQVDLMASYGAKASGV